MSTHLIAKTRPLDRARFCDAKYFSWRLPDDVPCRVDLVSSDTWRVARTTWASPLDVVRAVARHTPQFSHDRSWLGETGTREQTIASLCRLECPARKLLPVTSSANIAPTTAPVCCATVVGGMPIVPRAIHGHPIAMLGLQDSPSSRGLLRVYVGICTSKELTPTEILQRSDKILALIRHLQSRRAVDLWAYSSFAAERVDCLQGTYMLIHIGITPIARRPLECTLARVSFSRYGVFALHARYFGFEKGWGAGEGHTFNVATIRAILGASPDDLVLPSWSIMTTKDPTLRVTADEINRQFMASTDVTNTIRLMSAAT